MKTTLDIPDQLYREAKAVAALHRIRMKDLVTRGLRLAIEQPAHSSIKSPIEVLREIRQRKLHTHNQVTDMIESANQARKSGWNQDDLR